MITQSKNHRLKQALKPWAASVGFSFLLFTAITHNYHPFIKTALLLGWFFATTILGTHITKKILPTLNAPYLWLSSCLTMVMMGTTMNIFTAWFALTTTTITIALNITAFTILALSQIKNKERTEAPLIISKPDLGKKTNIIAWTLLFILLGVGATMIALSRTGVVLSSPWNTLPLWFGVIVGATTALSYVITFSSKKFIAAIAAISLASLLLHSYTLVYKESFGGDRWRHVGSENRILHNLSYEPNLFNTNNPWRTQIGPISIPRALIDGAKLSYGFQWSLTVLTSKTTNLNPHIIDIWIGIISYSLFLPLIIALITIIITKNYRTGLFAATALTLFFSLQYYGAQTLPLTYSLIATAFIILLFCAYVATEQPYILITSLTLTTLMYFQYSLGFLITLIALAWALAIRFQKTAYTVLALAATTLIALLELFSPTNQVAFGTKTSSLYTILMKSNILFFSNSTQSIIRTIESWHGFTLVTILTLFAAIYGFHIASKQKSGRLIAVLGAILITTYLFSYTVLTGTHTLSRRLGPFIALFLVPLITICLYSFITTKRKILLLSMLLSLITTATYLSGPTLAAVVSSDETAVMQYVWNKVQKNPKNTCVLADTWPLLALEAYSSKQIIAGNFPSDENYQQPERVAYFKAIQTSPSITLLGDILTKTNTSNCFIVLRTQAPHESLRLLLGNPTVIASHAIWSFSSSVTTNNISQ